MSLAIQNEAFLRSLPTCQYLDWEKLPRISAVYFLVLPHWQVVYVGQTRNLYLRWKNRHHWKDVFEMLNPAFVCWQCIEPRKLDVFESLMIETFEPLCNRNWARDDIGKKFLELWEKYSYLVEQRTIGRHRTERKILRKKAMRPEFEHWFFKRMPLTEPILKPIF